MKYLVTGCAGFIASRTAELLLEDGHSVVGVDSVNDAYDPRLKEWRLSRLKGRKGFEFHHADITDRAVAQSLAEEGPFDAIVNLAARAGVRQSVENPWVYVDANVTGTLNLLELARETDVKRFLLASTSSLYGSHNPRPFREDADTSRPLSPYAASKKGAEAMVASYAHLYGLDAVVVRYFTVYGPAGRPDMSVFRFVRWIAEGDPVTVHGDGSQERDFTYVDDIARGTIAALRPKGHHVVNLGSDRPVRLSRVIELIEERTGRRANVVRKPVHAADVPATWADISKARQLLGWEPKVPIEEGIARAVDWYRENRDWARHVDLGDA